MKPKCDKCGNECSISPPLSDYLKERIKNESIIVCPRYFCVSCKRTSKFPLSTEDYQLWINL